MGGGWVTGLHGFTYIIIIAFTPLFYFSFWFCLRNDMKFRFNKHVFEGACEKILYKCVWFSIENQFLDQQMPIFFQSDRHNLIWSPAYWF